MAIPLPPLNFTNQSPSTSAGQVGPVNYAATNFAPSGSASIPPVLLMGLGVAAIYLIWRG